MVIKKLKSLCSLARLAMENRLEIVSVLKNQNGLNVISTRICNKNIPPYTKDPLDIMKQSKIRDYAEKDIQTILNCALANQKQKLLKPFQIRYKLVSHRLSKEINTLLITYRDLEKDKLNIKPIMELYQNKKLIRGFSHEDCLCIGYFASSDVTHSNEQPALVS